MADNKMHRMKNKFIKIQEKLQDRMDELQDQVQNKIERSKISKFISHLSEERNSIDSFESVDKSSSDGDVGSEYLSVPSFVIDKPEELDVKDSCKHFINIEQGGLYKSVSACNLAYDENRNYNSSSDSCFSCISSSDERETGIRPRAGSLPPGSTNLVQPSAGTCTDLIEKLGNHFPRLKSQGDRIHRV